MYVFFLKLSRLMAYLGGIMLSALVVLTCASVLGRIVNGYLHSGFMEGIAPDFATWALNLGIGPINGDFELIEAGIAFSIFAFLPLCQITGGHASVDIFTKGMSQRVNTLLRLVTEILFAAVLILIATQLYGGMASKFRSGQTSFLLEFPVWWSYAPSLLGAVVAATVATYMAVARIQETMTGRTILPPNLDPDPGAEH